MLTSRTMIKFSCRTMLIAGLALPSALSLSCNKDERTQPEPSRSGPSEPSSQAPTQIADGSASVSPMSPKMQARCPMAVAGTDVAVSDTDDGVALTFTTAKGDVDELRERVERMDQMYEMHGGHGGMMWHHMRKNRQREDRGPGMGMGMGAHGPMPAVEAEVTEVDNGARIELTPTDSAQLEALRDHIRQHQQRMTSGECWMLPSEDDNG